MHVFRTQKVMRILTDFAIKNANTETLFSVFTNVRTQK